MPDNDPTPSTTTTAAATPSSVTTTSSVKPAWKTSEAYFNFATAVVGAATTFGFIGPGTNLDRFIGMGMMVFAAAIHTFSRTSIKNGAVAP